MLGNYINMDKKLKSPIKQKTNNIDLIFKEKNELLPQIKKMVYNNNNGENLDTSVDLKQQSSSLDTTSKDNLNAKNFSLTRMNNNINTSNHHEHSLQRPVKPNCNLFNFR
jgi:hypothetical protein